MPLSGRPHYSWTWAILHGVGVSIAIGQNPIQVVPATIVVFLSAASEIDQLVIRSYQFWGARTGSLFHSLNFNIFSLSNFVCETIFVSLPFFIEGNQTRNKQ